ncbi:MULTISPECIES: hypothetical protein [unclassified Nocardioides]|jgi:hypothetical protein|uniref:hypothetical protein n=1 Tax=Nocardioides sp. URHA0032 TaxID=1380388 RepID=UPI000685E954|nr:hypothetical protein [Nocardioides sp. URHA0032]
MSALPTYEADQLAGLLAILPDVDAVELKLSVPDSDHRSALRSLGIDSLDAQVRQVAFVETPDLRLFGAGLVVRARRTQGKPGDTTVKLRPMLPADVPEGLRRLAGFKVEVDASPQGYTCSCSLTSEVPDKRVKALMAGERELADVLSDDQRGVLLERLPDGIGLADLVVLGPLTLLKAKFEHPSYPRRLVAEMWFLPDGSRIMELSAKCSPQEAFQAAAETKIFLAGHGLELGAPQEMKTRSALAALAAAHQKE